MKVRLLLWLLWVVCLSAGSHHVFSQEGALPKQVVALASGPAVLERLQQHNVVVTRASVISSVSHDWEEFSCTVASQQCPRTRHMLCGGTVLPTALVVVVLSYLDRAKKVAILRSALNTTAAHSRVLAGCWGADIRSSEKGVRNCGWCSIEHTLSVWGEPKAPFVERASL